MSNESLRVGPSETVTLGQRVWLVRRVGWDYPQKHRSHPESGIGVRAVRNLSVVWVRLPYSVDVSQRSKRVYESLRQIGL